MKTITESVTDLLNRAPVPLGKRDSIFVPASGSSKGRRTKNLSAMEAAATIFAIVDRIATGVASARWRLYRSSSSGNKEDRTEVRSHAALNVWTKPNPFYSQDEFVETMFQHYELTGEWWWVLARSSLLRGGGPPLELWPVRPDRMTPIPHPTKYISGYAYSAGRDLIPLKVDQVIYNRRPNPLDPYRGIGPVGTLLLDLEGEKAAAEWNANFFKNNAEPGGLVKFAEELTDAEFTAFLERWRQSHQGVANAGRVGILEGDAEWIDRKFSMRDMQFEQLRRYSRGTFREAWGFPKPLLGDVEDVNRANAEAGEVVFARWLIVPRLNKLRTTLNDDFLPMFGRMADGLEFDYDEVVPPNHADDREDMRMRVTSAVSLVAQGYDPDETLAAFDLPEIPFKGKPGAGQRMKLMAEPDEDDPDNPPETDE